MAPDLGTGDDRMIAVAFRRSMFAAAAVAAAVGALVAVRLFWPTEEAERAKDLTAPAPLVAAESQLPEIRFTDVTEEANITHRHQTGAAGDVLLPETMGGGVAVLDADGDGDPDLLFVGGRPWPWNEPRPVEPSLRLYFNDGHARFVDQTNRRGLSSPIYGMGAAVGDIDGDGDTDLYITAVGENRLYRNDGSRFVDVTRSSGTGGAENDWSTTAGFLDIDGDADLDLFVCNYVRWSRDIDHDVGFTLNGIDRAYGPPTAFEGTFPVLYRNDGGGRFTDISEAAGMRVLNPTTERPMSKALGATFVDIDDDQRLDIVVANDTVRNFLFHNRGDGTFSEIGAASGLGFDTEGRATGAMGIDAADYRGSGLLGFAIGNFANEMSSLYVQQGAALQFADEAILEGIGSPSRLRLSFGVLFLDADLDGRIDFLQVNGHLEPAISEVQASQQHAQPAQLFWNRGSESSAVFAPLPDIATGDLTRPIVGRAATTTDLDGDGDLDLVVTQNGGPPRVLRNDQSTGNHWLRIHLVGTSPSTDAIGARLELVNDGRVLRRRVMPTRGYLSQVETTVTFGLGETAQVDSLRILWPDGTEQVVGGLEVDTVHVIRQVPPAAPDLPGVTDAAAER